MGLTICPDCSHEVSTIALTCPHCGRPMQAELRKVMTIKDTYVNYIMLGAVLLQIGIGIYIIKSGLPLFFLKLPGFTVIGIGIIYVVYHLAARK